MKNSIIYILFYLIYFESIYSQPIIGGFVRDLYTKNPISDAIVVARNDNADNRFTTPEQRTDLDGHFNIQHSKIQYGGKIILQVMHDNYELKQQEYEIKRYPSMDQYDVYLRQKNSTPDVLDKYFNEGQFCLVTDIYEKMANIPPAEINRQKIAKKLCEGINALEKCEMSLATYLFKEALELCSNPKFTSVRDTIMSYINLTEKQSQLMGEIDRLMNIGEYEQAIDQYKDVKCKNEHTEIISLLHEILEIKNKAEQHMEENNYLPAMEEFLKIRIRNRNDTYAKGRIRKCHSSVFNQLSSANKKLTESPSEEDYKYAYSIYDKYRKWLYRDNLNKDCNAVDYEKIIIDYQLDFERIGFFRETWKDVLSVALLQLADIHYSKRITIDTPSCGSDCNVVRGVMLFTLVRNGRRAGQREASEFLSRIDRRFKEMAEQELKTCRIPF